MVYIHIATIHLPSFKLLYILHQLSSSSTLLRMGIVPYNTNKYAQTPFIVPVGNAVNTKEI